MRTRRPAPALLAAALGAAACAPVPPPAPESAVIRVPVNVERTAAFDATESAFRAEGLSIAEASAHEGVVTSTPVAAPAGLPVVYQAMILQTPGGVVVVLSGAARNEARATDGRSTAGAALEPAEQPLLRMRSGQLDAAWRRLERIAIRLREP